MSFRARKAFCSASGMACHCSCGLNQPAWNTDAVGTSHGALCQASSAKWGRMGARAGSSPCRNACTSTAGTCSQDVNRLLYCFGVLCDQKVP